MVGMLEDKLGINIKFSRVKLTNYDFIQTK